MPPRRRRRNRPGGATRHRRARSRARRQRRRVEHEDARLRALHAVALMRREGLSLRAAAKRVGVSPRTTVGKARPALRKRGGRYEAIPLDELQRPMRVLTERGPVVLNIRSSKTASRLATYWNAVDAYGQTGDRRSLASFVGKRFRAEGHLMEFITDPAQLDRLIYAGQVSFEELYEPTA